MAPGIPSQDLIRSALSALSLRQRTITNNIANVDTPGFRASDVSFEERLQSAMGGGGALELRRTMPGHLTASGSSGSGVSGQLVTSSNTVLREDGNNVDIEQQMLRLSETVITYGALARLASGRLALMRSAISEGRR